MRANNLSISVPNKGCDKNCPYCVSKMTGHVKADTHLMHVNSVKVKKFATMAGVTSISITGKGEPMLNFEFVTWLCKEFNDFPIELQTNGIKLLKNLELVEELSRSGVDVIAVSIDLFEDIERFVPLFKKIDDLSMTSRITVNITDLLPDPSEREGRFQRYIEACKEFGIHQLSFRKVVAPRYTHVTDAHRWIREHADNDYYDLIVEQMLDVVSNKNGWKRPPLRVLPYGAKLYDIEGIAVTHFDYCIQDTNNGDDIRSLIWLEDGHLYTSWNSLASRIF